MNTIWKRARRAAFAGALLAALAACAPEPAPGAPDISRLQQPLSPDYLQIVSVAPDLVEVDAAGNVVRVTPPDGLCIPLDSIQTGPESVFMIFAECPGAPRAGLGGVLSISVSRMPLAGGLPALERFFDSPKGVIGLGYGGDRADVSMVETMTGPRALYAVVEDRSEFGPAFAGDLICRAFTEIDDRMTVVTLISRRGERQEAAGMRAKLAEIVAALHAGNA
ncbi:hypothetical protein G5B40_07795 [Pikeienuella piscinae]|uniref:Uncharacterized protein n=1 Tax=Pikeienuella piscinae TaxID=2748098 RepID=A0A7L5BXW8_9RHOB|nr:hypothetical protein [Pikeienuella piscinae]QIE55367.1 hypothetical protein G5B40_07795 [Pikeienuella piscinae]